MVNPSFLLFIIYINDIANASEMFDFIIDGDDITLSTNEPNYK